MCTQKQKNECCYFFVCLFVCVCAHCEKNGTSIYLNAKKKIFFVRACVVVNK